MFSKTGYLLLITFYMDVPMRLNGFGATPFSSVQKFPQAKRTLFAGGDEKQPDTKSVSGEWREMTKAEQDGWRRANVGYDVSKEAQQRNKALQTAGLPLPHTTSASSHSGKLDITEK